MFTVTKVITPSVITYISVAVAKLYTSQQPSALFSIIKVTLKSSLEGMRLKMSIDKQSIKNMLTMTILLA
jgi:hypothetical protein